MRLPKFFGFRHREYVQAGPPNGLAGMVREARSCALVGAVFRELAAAALLTADVRMRRSMDCRYQSSRLTVVPGPGTSLKCRSVAFLGVQKPFFGPLQQRSPAARL